jgi:hypothetical protein
MTFVLRTKRVYPALASHESVQYWNAGWFYVKNIPVPGVHDGLPSFANKAPEELASWSLFPLSPITRSWTRWREGSLGSSMMV